MNATPCSPPAQDLPAACHSLMERSPVPTAELEGTAHVLRYVNSAFCRLVGKPRDKLIGRPFTDTIQEGDTLQAVLDGIYRSGEAATHTEAEQPGHHPPYWSYAVWPLLDPDQHPVGVMMQVTETTSFHQQAAAVNEALLISSVRQHELTAVAEELNARLQTEILERERYEGRQRTLLNELNHRVKNTLATVQSVVRQTLRNTSDTDDAWERIEGRLVALAQAHDTLTRESWEGAPIEQIVEEAVLPYRGERGERFDIEGPAVWVPPHFALALAMGLHELCTNAVKYGALSNDAGRVVIVWTVVGRNGDDGLRITWTESGGPRVMPPTRRGFGSRLIERGLKQDLGGEVRIEFAPAGLVCTIEAPLPGRDFGSQGADQRQDPRP